MSLKKWVQKFNLAVLIALSLAAAETAHAEGVAPVPPEVDLGLPEAAPQAPAAQPAEARPAPAVPSADRQKKLDFEDSVIEGMNRDPLDAVQHLGKKDPGAAGRLFRKKPNFRAESKRTLQEAGYTP